MSKPIIVVWFSCGAASAVAAKLTCEMYGQTHEIIIANTHVTEEDSDNLRFLQDISEWLQRPILRVVNYNLAHSSAKAVWQHVKYMSNRHGAPCTVKIKKEARYLFELNQHIDFHVLGFTADEKSRHDRFIKYERSNVLPVLIDMKFTKQDCFKYLESEGLKLPNVYYQGYPNANCIGCVKASSSTYWNHVRRMHPEIFKDRAAQSRELGAKLVYYKGKRIYLDELPESAKGYKMKGYDCGVFCQTK